MIRIYPARYAMAVLLTFMVAVGCGRNVRQDKFAFRMGDKVSVPPFTYTVIEARWQPQLGDIFSTRVPEHQFLLMRLTITNSGGKEESVPLLNLEDSQGRRYQELSNGQGVDGWLGVLRSIPPAQTEDGWILFDVPQNSYLLRCPGAGDDETEQIALVQIPLTLDSLHDTIPKADAPSVPTPSR